MNRQISELSQREKESIFKICLGNVGIMPLVEVRGERLYISLDKSIKFDDMNNIMMDTVDYLRTVGINITYVLMRGSNLEMEAD